MLSFWPPRCDYLYLPASLYRPAPTYRGHRPGFVFKTCDGHTGYWADVADEEDTTNLVTLVRLQDIVRSAPAAPAPTAGTDFVVPPVRQSYKQRISGCRRAPEDAGRVYPIVSGNASQSRAWTWRLTFSFFFAALYLRQSYFLCLSFCFFAAASARFASSESRSK